MKWTNSRMLLGLAAIASTLAVTACGSSSSAQSSGSAASTGGSASAPASSAKLAPFSGPESTLATSFDAPTVKSGVTFKLGYLNPQAGVQSLDQSEAGAAAETKALGGSFVAYSINSDPATQVADFRTLLSQHVTAIALQPADPAALAPLLKEAAAAGIPVISTSTPAAASLSNLPGYASDVLEGVDRCAYDDVAAIAKAKPGATYAMITSSLPYPSLQLLVTREEYWAQKLGLKMVGSESTGQAITPASGATAMSEVLVQHPTVDAAFGWDDSIAEGAATTQKARAHGSVMVVGFSGDTAAITMIKSGTMFGTCRYDSPALGKDLAIGAYDAQTHQHLPLPAKIVVNVTELTKSNA